MGTSLESSTEIRSLEAERGKGAIFQSLCLGEDDFELAGKILKMKEDGRVIDSFLNGLVFTRNKHHAFDYRVFITSELGESSPEQELYQVMLKNGIWKRPPREQRKGGVLSYCLYSKKGHAHVLTFQHSREVKYTIDDIFP